MKLLPRLHAASYIPCSTYNNSQWYPYMDTYLTIVYQAFRAYHNFKIHLPYRYRCHTCSTYFRGSFQLPDWFSMICPYKRTALKVAPHFPTNPSSINLQCCWIGHRRTSNFDCVFSSALDLNNIFFFAWGLVKHYLSSPLNRFPHTYKWHSSLINQLLFIFCPNVTHTLAIKINTLWANNHHSWWRPLFF